MHTHTQLNRVYLASMLGITHMIKCASSLFFLSGERLGMRLFPKGLHFLTAQLTHVLLCQFFLVMSNFHQCTEALKINEKFLK